MFHGSFARQREKLALRLDEVLRKYLSDTAAPDVTDTLEEVYGEYAIGNFPEQYEMRFFLGDVHCFTPELANRLRSLVSREFPKWTVVPQFDECVFTVRPDGAEFDGHLVKGEVREDTPAFARWKVAALKYDERTYGVLRSQLRWVTPQVPECLKRLQSERAVLIGVFDGSESDEGDQAWLLVDSKNQKVSFGAVKAPSDSYGVTSKGSLLAKYSRHSTPSACLLVYHCHPPHPVQVQVISNEEGTIATVTFPRVVNGTELRTAGGEA